MIFNPNPETKAGIVMLVLMAAVFLLGDRLGLVADKQTMLYQERNEISQLLVDDVSKDLRSGNPSRVPTTLNAFLERHPFLDGAKFDSTLISATAGAMTSDELADDMPADSTAGPGYLVVKPVYDGTQRVGTLEVLFSGRSAPGTAAMSNYSVAVLLFLFTAGGFLFHRAFMGRSKEELEIGSVLPTRIKEAFDSLAEGVLVLDETGRITHANRAFKESCCMQSYMLAGTWLHDLEWRSYTDAEIVEEPALPWMKVLRTGDAVVGTKLTLRTEDDIERSYGVNCTPLHETGSESRGVIITLDNLTELEKRNATLKKSISELEQAKQSIDVENRELQLLASQDSLTNCLNRRAFTERYNTLHAEAASKGHSLVCMMIDIDRFKRINDNYGHALGDKVIKYVARVLEQEIRQDDLLGRYGGEEFCIVMENMSLQHATDAAERMRRKIAQGDASLFGSALRTTASIGVARMDRDVVGSDELMHRADKALYLAKESGRNKVMAWEDPCAVTGADDADEAATGSRPGQDSSVVVRPFFGETSVTERDWQLEEIADANTAQLGQFVLPVSREHFCEKNLFVDRVNQALLLARRESRVIAVMSLGVSIARHDSMPLDADLIDMALQGLAGRLRAKLRSSDVVVVFPDVASLNALPIVADAELGILLPATCDAEAAGWVAKRVSEMVQEPLCVEDQQLTVRSHLGVALFPNDAGDGVALTQAACVARLYCESQEETGGIEFCSGHFNAQFKQKAQLQDDMVRAIDNNEFELLFQPKVAVPGGEIIGFESLLRWNHPRRGLLTPNEFLDIAERTGLITMIGDWVLRQSCRQIVQLSEASSRRLICAVNMSVVQLAQPDLVEQVLRALEEEGLPPACLELELTEDALQGGLDQRFAQLTELQAHGIQVAIDDFGAGCNGLNYLRSLPVDILKVDRHFVADLAENDRDSAILAAFLGMARTLNLRVVAEGVESRAQFEALSSLGCSEAQGYLFGRPMAGEAAQALLLDASPVAHAG